MFHKRFSENNIENEPEKGERCKICFNLKEVAVDGNVMRVYWRVCNLDLDVGDLKVKKEIALEIVRSTKAVFFKLYNEMQDIIQMMARTLVKRVIKYYEN